MIESSEHDDSFFLDSLNRWMKLVFGQRRAKSFLGLVGLDV